MADIDCPVLPDLGLVGDGDVHAMVRDLERAFRVDFGDGFGGWATVGDIEATLAPLFPADAAPGPCAAVMAFYTLRRALGLGRDVAPDAKLATLRLGSCIGVFGALERDLGFHMPEAAVSSAGLLGMTLFWLGLPGWIGLHVLTHRWWPGPLLIVVGALMWGADRGSFADRTLGGLARDVALLNYGMFAARGADRRPETIWRVLRRIVCRQTGADPNAVARSTRLLAERIGRGARAPRPS